MILERVTARLSASRKAQLESALGKLEWHTGGGHIVSNLKIESFIAQKSMAEIAGCLIRHSTKSAGVMLQEYMNTCFANVLRGGKVKRSAVPKLIGRAVEKDAWISSLISANPSMSRRYVRDFVERLLVGRLRRIDVLNMSAMQMSPFAAWVTWDLSSGGDDRPFHAFRRENADSIRGSLGLDDSSLGTSIVLIEYKPKAVGELYRPTVADAGLHLRFLPISDPKADFGRTRHWESHPSTINGQAANLLLEPMPEALHSPTTMDTVGVSELRAAL